MKSQENTLKKGQRALRKGNGDHCYLYATEKVPISDRHQKKSVYGNECFAAQMFVILFKRRLDIWYVSGSRNVQ